MGLDITAYSKLTAVGQHTPDGDWCEDKDHVSAYAYECFPRSFRGIPVLSTEVTSGSKFLIGGCYETTAATKVHSFRAGSYSGYGMWREDLARQFNPCKRDEEPNPEGPFYELIWFADNEGTIGELAAAQLLSDFRSRAGMYDPSGHPDYFREKYADWTRACELAADSGLISFH